MRQLDVFGGEHEPARESAPAACEQLEAFPLEAFSARVPGTLPLDTGLGAGEPHAGGGEPIAADPCPFCDSGRPATRSWLEDDGGPVGARLTCCDACWDGP